MRCAQYVYGIYNLFAISFKLHLRPSECRLETNGLEIGHLPQGKSAEEVMGDFMRYLYDQTADYIRLSHADGKELWDKVKGKEIFVLGHPNGWQGASQQRYRKSAVLGGLISKTSEDHKRLNFVLEGEAGALACICSGLGPSTLLVSAH